MTEPAPTNHGSGSLGALLVEHGLLTPEQLAAALAEQERNPAPLGQTVVRLGLTSAAAVAQALATQQGGVAKTEFGMAVGFGTSLPAAASPLPPVTTSGPAFSVAELRAQLEDAERRLDAMAEQMVTAARRIAQLLVERDHARAEAASLRRVA